MRFDRSVKHLDDMVVFAEVVEQNSITAAAKALRMSPSAVSRRLARLEEDLGIRLINRSTHHMSLTEGGSILYRHCSRGLSEFEKGISSAEELNRDASGLLRIHAALGVGQCIVVPTILEFAKAYPSIRIELEVSEGPVNLLEEDLDVSIGGKAFADEGMGDLVSVSSVELFSAPYMICASEEYLKGGPPLKAPEDLANHNCLLHTAQLMAGEWWFTEDAGDKKVKVSGNLVTNNGTAIYQATIGGLGVARLPSYRVQDDIACGRLKLLFAKNTKSDRAIKAYYPRTPHLPAKLRVFLEFVTNRLKTSADSAVRENCDVD